MDTAKTTTPQIQIMHAVIIFIAGAVLGAILEQALTSFVLPVESFTLLLIFSCLVLLSFMLLQMVKHTDDLRHNIGLRIMYFDRDRHSRATLFSEARKIIEKAKNSIFVLNSILPETPENEEDMPEMSKWQNQLTIQERDRYYESLVERAGEGVTYERIIQLRSDQSVQDVAKDKGYIKHFHRVLEIKDKNGNLPIGLIKAPAKRLSTFVLVDDEVLIWQINEVLKSGGVQMHGIFIIQDPRHEITQHFRAFVESAKRESFGAIHREELPAILQDKEE